MECANTLKRSKFCVIFFQALLVLYRQLHALFALEVAASQWFFTGCEPDLVRIQDMKCDSKVRVRMCNRAPGSVQRDAVNSARSGRKQR